MLAKWIGWVCGSLALLSLPVWADSRHVERVAAAEQFQEARKVAVVVGVEQYAPSIGALKYAVDDAQLIAQALRLQGYTVQLLTDSQATPAAILDRIEQVGKTLPDGNGTLVFFFSGHGFAENNSNYLATFGTVLGRLQSSALPLKAVEAEIRKTQVKRAILFVDACRNAPNNGIKSVNRGFIYEQSEGMKLLFATKFAELSYERDELKQGVFSHFLNRALRGQAAEADGLITFDSLTRYVQEETADWTLQHLGQTQRPYTQDLKENFGVLVLGQTTAAKPVPPEPEPKPEPEPVRAVVTATPVRPASASSQRLPFEPEMVDIPAGSFTMGCLDKRDQYNGGCADDERPAHIVNLNAFQIGKYEITFKEWDACEQAMACPHIDDQKWGRDLRPVINVNWYDVQTYIKWLNQQTGKNYRLPTEAEWEYTARAGSESTYSWGNDINCSRANYGSIANACKAYQTQTVGYYTPNNMGIYDMVGNVWEWVQDWYDGNYYRSSPNANPQGPKSGTNRVLRGGSWNDYDGDVRAARRSRNNPITRNDAIGFRLALNH